MSTTTTTIIRMSTNNKSSSSSGSSSKTPSMVARYTTASIFTCLLSIWGYYAYLPPPPPNGGGGGVALHPRYYYGGSRLDDGAGGGYPIIVPLGLTSFYLLSLPLLTYITTTQKKYCSSSLVVYYTKYDMKALLHETMILYNMAQVILNGWMVYTILVALLYQNHPFIGSRAISSSSGSSAAAAISYAVHVHYCDKYLEFVDTYFMILRGKMDQVSVGVTTMERENVV